MSKSKKKRLRQEAIKAEKARREQDRRDRSPLSQGDMLELVGYVGARIMVDGHTHDFIYTRKWLSQKLFNEKRVLHFFESVKISDDWSLCTEGDPYKLFGASKERLSWMPIEQSQLESLQSWLDDEIDENGCNHDLSHTTKWLEDNSCPVHPTLMALLAHGGGCDCEVVLNVEPESIYP